MKRIKLFEQFINEAKMPDKLIGNDEIVFLKTKEDSRGAHYNLYYKGHDIEKGGARFGSEKELKAFADDYILSNQWYNKLKYEDSKPLPESVVNEGGNAVEESRPMKQSEVIKTFEWAEKNILPVIGLAGKGVDYSPIGSYAKKSEDVTSGDIDIAVSVDKIAGVNGLTFEEVLPWLDEKLKALGYSTKMVRGFEQISFGAPINGDFKNGVGQIDLMLSTDLNWSKFMYHSPNFITGESKYKGMYRNVLLMSIVSEMFKESSKLTPEGDTEQYKQYVVRLEKGIYQVEKSFMGKKGSLIKTAKLLKDQDKFITNTPEEVVELAFGEGVKPLEVMTFEDAWVRLRSPKFPHKKKLDQILNRFKAYILASKMPLPSEAVEAYPNLF